jgi:hypothetical protein
MTKNQNVAVLTVSAVIAVLAISSALFVTSGGQEGQQGRDVVMLRCSTTDTVFKSTGYSGSSGTPSKRSENCSENISQLLKDRFVIHDVGHYHVDESSYVVFTMVR